MANSYWKYFYETMSGFFFFFFKQREEILLKSRAIIDMGFIEICSYQFKTMSVDKYFNPTWNELKGDIWTFLFLLHRCVSNYCTNLLLIIRTDALSSLNTLLVY